MLKVGKFFGISLLENLPTKIKFNSCKMRGANQQERWKFSPYVYFSHQNSIWQKYWGKITNFTNFELDDFNGFHEMK